MATPSQPVGQTVSHYRILSRIGGGGMGVVYEAEDHYLCARPDLDYFRFADDLGVTSELRQSTTVPNVSKTHAFTLADSNFIKPPVSCWTRTAGSSENDVAMTLAPRSHQKSPPIQLEPHTKSLST
jgi:hypothetical protein